MRNKIFQLAAGGLIDSTFKQVLDEVALLAEEKRAEISAPVQLGLYHMQGAFFIWTMLLPSALLAFAFELCKSSKKNNNEIANKF